MSSVDEILQQIESCQVKGKTKLIAVDGRGGSGKSSFVKELVSLRPTLKVIPVDAFPCTPERHPLHPLGTQTWIDWERLRDEALLPLAQGRDAEFVRTFWWPSQSQETCKKVSPGGIVIVEGCYSLRRELRPLYDFRIWIECPLEEALAKAIRRDGEDVRVHWENAYSPNETSYIQAHNPMAAANVILLNSGDKRFELIRSQNANNN